MNPKDNLSPEEKLLHLIRQPAQKNAPKADAHKDTSSPKKKTTIGGVSPTPSERRDKKREKMVLSGVASINFVTINRCMLLFLFVVTSFFVADLYFNNPTAQPPIVSHFTAPEVSLEKKQAQPFSYYKDIIVQRALFKAHGGRRSTKQAMPAGPTFRDLIKNLNLLGIVSGEQQQAIIEDTKLKKTYFLYQGDYLGEIKIEEIYSDKVVLEYKGEQVHLFI